MEEIEHTIPIEQLLEKLAVPKVTLGISDAVLMERLASDGYNLPSKTQLKASVLLILYENLTFIVYCTILTALLIELADKGPSCSLSHMTLICFTFVAHMLEIFTAEKPKIPKIGTLIAVIRNGTSNIVDSKYLVRGDIVEIEQSMVVPADIRIIKATNLLVNGSLILGKDGIRMGDAVGGGDFAYSSNILLQGFKIETGKAIGVVLRTGSRTVLSNSYIRSTSMTTFELNWLLLLLFLFAITVGINRNSHFIAYQSALTLLLVLTKFPHFIRKGRSINLLCTSHLLISHEIYPKTIHSASALKDTKYLIYDIRDSLITSQKVLKKVYINDRLQEITRVKIEGDFAKLLKLTNFMVYKEKVVRKKKEPVSMEEWDPMPEEVEYINPIEQVLREYLEENEIPLGNHKLHYKIPLNSKNRNSLSVLTPSNSSPLAILIGEASEVLKSSKSMTVNGKAQELPLRTLTSMCEELLLEGNICIAVSYCELDPSVIKPNAELGPDIFDFSLLGVFVIKEFSENNNSALELAQSLNITPVGIGRDSKDYLVNICHSADLITKTPQDYKNVQPDKWTQVIFTPNQAVKSPKSLENTCAFIPNISVFDTALLINQMKREAICYLGSNHIALQVSDVGVSLTGAPAEIKDYSNFVALSQKPLSDLLQAIKALRAFGSHDFFFMQDLFGCLIPSLAYFCIGFYLDFKMSSLGILYVDFAVPLSSQFLWIGFPRHGYSNPLLVWVLITLAAFQNFFTLRTNGFSPSECSFGYFFTLLLCGQLKVIWLHLWNFRNKRIAWAIPYVLIGVKISCFCVFCLIRFVAIRNELEAVEVSYIWPGLLSFILMLGASKLVIPY